jgi:hypothetical protein
MRCKFCGELMTYVHGHVACLNNLCTYYGSNQAECCDGETAANSPAPTSTIAAVPAVRLGFTATPMRKK